MNQLFLVAVLATAFYVANLLLFVTLHTANSEYSVRKHAVSDYGVGKTSKLFLLYGWVGNLGALALAYLFFYSERPNFPTSIALYTVFLVAARISTLIFKTDLEGEKHTKQGILHYLSAILNFTFAYLVLADATQEFATLPALELLRSFLAVAKTVAAISLAGVVITMFKPLRHIFGIVERVFIVSTALWFLAASLAFLTLNAR